MRQVFVLFIAGSLACLGALGCDKGGDAAAPTGTGVNPGATGAAATGTADCSAVVAKLASFDTTAGDAEKKFWAKACEGMPPAMRSCIVASKTKEERDACDKGGKPVK
jgi:hypothetical protein